MTNQCGKIKWSKFEDRVFPQLLVFQPKNKGDIIKWFSVYVLSRKSNSENYSPKKFVYPFKHTKNNQGSAIITYTVQFIMGSFPVTPSNTDHTLVVVEFITMNLPSLETDKKKIREKEKPPPKYSQS